MKADSGNGSSAIARPIRTSFSTTAVPFLTRRKDSLSPILIGRSPGFITLTG